MWGAGQQQVRNVHASIGALAVNLTMYSLVEAWAWARREEEVADRSRSPWDTEERRPSHADKRKARCNARSSGTKSRRLCRGGGSGRNFKPCSPACSIWPCDYWVFAESTDTNITRCLEPPRESLLAQERVQVSRQPRRYGGRGNRSRLVPPHNHVQ